MTYEDLLPILNDLYAEIQLNSPDMSAVILVGDHKTGQSRYYTSGFPEVQVNLINLFLLKHLDLAKMMLELQNEKGS